MIKNILKKIIPKRLHRRLRKIIKKERYFVEGLNSGYQNLPYKALLYYKTNSLTNKRLLRSYSHTNLWEVTEKVSILNRLGFEVDVIDRGADNFTPQDKYDIFIGLAISSSGKYFGKYAKAVPGALKVAYVTGANPAVAHPKNQQRYERFKERTGVDAPRMRAYPDDNFDEFAQYADYIFCVAEEGTFSFNSYKKYNKPIYSIMPGTSPDINFNPAWLKTRKRNHFLCFAGNGFIHKGVDILVEAFKKMPEYKLTICGPDSEEAFFDAYGSLIENAPNINYEGFIQVGGKRFREICEQASFIILHSASESCCTSVVTGMRAGLVPIINPETSINVGGFGFLMVDENKVQDIINNVQKAANISDDEYSERVYKTLMDSAKYTQASFTKSFMLALLDIMHREERFH